MINNYPFHSSTPKGLETISAHQASELISKFNIYFKTLAIPTDEHRSRYFNFDYIDHNIYQIDNIKSFDKQYAHIKTITFPDTPTVTFYTDYIQNKELVENRIILAHYILMKRCKTINVSNLKSTSKQPKEFVEKYIDSLEKNKTTSLFDLEQNQYEGISPNIKKDQIINNREGVSANQIDSLNNVGFAVGLNKVHL